METKKQLRNKMKTLRDALPIESQLEYSRTISETLISERIFQSAKNILVYMAIGSEVRTEEIIRTGLHTDQRIWIPKVLGKDMEFYEIRDFQECRPGFMGILEPDGEGRCFRANAKDKKEDTLILLPGLAFDEKGKRLGYGGGYYDRYLAKYDNCIKIGIAYELQCGRDVPTDQTDVVMDMVVTEKGIRKTVRRKQ